MFSVAEKRRISDLVQIILRETGNPELPDGEIQFILSVKGGLEWQFANIRNNGAEPNPGVNPWNEEQSKKSDPVIPGSLDIWHPSQLGERVTDRFPKEI